MARSHFGGTSVDWLVKPYKFGARTLLALDDDGAVITFWSAATGGTQYTDLLDANGAAVDRVTATGHQIPDFQAPDGILAMWADKGDGTPREKVEAQDLAGAAAAVASAQAARDAAIAATTSKAAKGAVGFYVADYYSNSTPTAAQQHTALAAACAAASAVGGTVILSQGTTQVVGSFPLSGYSCSIVGQSIRTDPASSRTPLGSVIQCVSQTGPVLDFTGFVPPPSYVGRLMFKGFTVQGDGTADSSSDTSGSVTVGGGTKKGIYSPARTLLACTFSDLLITNCGGIHLDLVESYLCSFRDIIVTDPISAAANNVPYVRLRALNGSDFYGLGIRSLVTPGTVGVGTAGAIRLEASTGANGYWDRAAFNGCWTENCWLPSSGSILVTQTTGVVHNGWKHFDAYKVTGATGTSLMRLEPSSVGGSVAGNLIIGFILGSARGTNDVDTGIELNQSYNRIDGVKGFPGHNVTIDSTIRESFIMLGGSGGASSTTVAVDDNSGRNDNTIIDNTVGLWQLTAASGQSAAMTIAGQHVRHNRTTATLNVASATVNPDMTTGADLFVYTLAATGLSIGSPTTTNQLERPMRIILKQDATGSRTVTWSGSFAWKSGSAPTLKTAANAVDTFTFVYDGALWQQV